jgi:hypothetical protein
LSDYKNLERKPGMGVTIRGFQFKDPYGSKVIFKVNPDDGSHPTVATIEVRPISGESQTLKIVGHNRVMELKNLLVEFAKALAVPQLCEGDGSFEPHSLCPNCSTDEGYDTGCSACHVVGTDEEVEAVRVRDYEAAILEYEGIEVAPWTVEDEHETMLIIANEEDLHHC